MNYFSQLIGQHQAVELLLQAVGQNHIAPAYLFVGSSGVGRSLAAKCFARLLLDSPQEIVQKRVSMGNHPDFLLLEPLYQHQGKLLTTKEVAAAGIKPKALPQIRIEQIREIRQFLVRPPLEASRLVIVIEEAQTMTEAAANALLKTLEEPGQATLILIAPNVESLLPTLVSRTQRIPFSRLSPEEMEQVLSSLERKAILAHQEILAIAQGSPGEAIAAFAQLEAIPEELRQQLKEPPNSPWKALEIAKTIDRELDVQTQIWLVDYLQYIYWQNYRQKNLLDLFEKARQYLLSYVQPRLVWECTLLAIAR